MVSNPRQAVPFLRMPVPVNPSPDVPTYEIQRAALQTFLDDLTGGREDAR